MVGRLGNLISNNFINNGFLSYTRMLIRTAAQLLTPLQRVSLTNVDRVFILCEHYGGTNLSLTSAAYGLITCGRSLLFLAGFFKNGGVRHMLARQRRLLGLQVLLFQEVYPAIRWLWLPCFVCLLECQQ